MSKYYFEKLTPINDADIEVYEKAIDFVMSDTDIKNIAISGAYGSGKSSLLESYKIKHGELKFLFISLSHFETLNSDNADRECKIKESILEGKILNQLIHQISPDKIKQTNFRVKKEIDKKKNRIEVAMITIFIIILFYIVFFKYWENLIISMNAGLIKKFLSLTLNSYFKLFIGILLIILLVYFVNFLLKLQKNRNLIRKLSFQGNEIEILEENEDSYFDKYLNEVLYLFENADADIIVFEDMDRFDADRIFERLREVNTLVNKSFVKENKEKVLRFFYLLRDDIFISKDRTKFFDFIIPVIPVIDSSNSYNIFISQLKKNDLFDKFDEHFLQNLSLYVDDMRLLKNICNEFLIYYYRLNTTDIKYNKMMAMITYKNLFPKDFSELQLNQGFVYSLFAHKNDFINEQKENIKSQIIEENEKIEYIKKENLESVEELKMILESKRDKIDDMLYLSSNRQRAENELTQWEKTEYINRKEAIENRSQNKIKDIELKISSLEKEISKINEYTLQEIITRDNIDEIFSITDINEIGEVQNFNEVKANTYFNLLKYVIREGYIDETYPDYMTYFYEEGLSRTDKLFLQSVTDKIAKDPAYKLCAPQKVFARLRIRDFEEEEILNFSLIDYVLNNQIDSNQLSHFISYIQNTKKFDFVFKYIDVTSNLPLLIETLNRMWPSFFKEISINENYISSDKLKKYSLLSLYYSEDQDIKNMNIDNCLCNYISNNRYYLNIDNPDNTKLILKFKLLGVSFTTIDFETANNDLFNEVYSNSLYTLNFENIELMLKKIYGVSSEENIIHKNFSLIRQYLNSPLYCMIRKNINEYTKIILEYCNGELTDDENSAIEILNTEDIDIDSKKDYISQYKNIISKIKEIEEKEIWDDLLKNRVIDYSEYNLMDYFLEKGLNSSLINYINSNDKNIDFSSISKEYENENFEKLFENIIIANELNDSKYEQIIKSLNFYYEKFNILEIERNKILILINEKIIRMNPETLIFLRNNYPDTVLYFIRKNIDIYEEIMNDDLFLHDELIEILSWDIDDSIKLFLLKFSTESISILKKNYSTDIKQYILKNNLDDRDMYTLFEEYDNLESSIQSVVLKYALYQTDTIIENFQNVSYQLKIELLKSSALDYEEKFNILKAMLLTSDKENAIKLLCILDLKDYIKILNTNERPRFKIDLQNQELLDLFVSKRWLYDYQEDLQKEGYYKIRRHAPKKKN